jgi:hypothetical protein
MFGIIGEDNGDDAGNGGGRSSIGFGASGLIVFAALAASSKKRLA